MDPPALLQPLRKTAQSFPPDTRQPGADIDPMLRDWRIISAWWLLVMFGEFSCFLVIMLMFSDNGTSYEIARVTAAVTAEATTARARARARAAKDRATANIATAASILAIITTPYGRAKRHFTAFRPPSKARTMWHCQKSEEEPIQTCVFNIAVPKQHCVHTFRSWPFMWELINNQTLQKFEQILSRLTINAARIIGNLPWPTSSLENGLSLDSQQIFSGPSASFPIPLFAACQLSLDFVSRAGWETQFVAPNGSPFFLGGKSWIQP